MPKPRPFVSLAFAAYAWLMVGLWWLVHSGAEAGASGGVRALADFRRGVLGRSVLLLGVVSALVALLLSILSVRAKPLPAGAALALALGCLALAGWVLAVQGF